MLFGAACLVLMPTSVLAQHNEAIAESLFIEGKQLFNEKRFAESCEKLDQSHRADPAGGTVLLLAMCYEQSGRTATAWAKYGEAVAMARRDGRQDRAKKAQEAMDGLSSRLSYATVALEPEAKKQSGIEFVLDDIAIPLLVDSKVPIDPGSHRLLVRAKGFESWTHEFQVTDPGAVVSITVPPLKPLPVETATTPAMATASQSPTVRSEPVVPIESPPAPERRSTSYLRTMGWVVGSLGLVSTGIGSYFAVKAKSLDNRANDRCPSVACNDTEAVGFSKDAMRDANLSTWLVGVGAAAMVAGGAMVIFGGNSGPQLSTTALALPNGGALSISGRY